MPPSETRFLVFDLESAADGDLVAKLRHPGERISAQSAVAKYRAELMEKYESDFIPYTYQLPVAVVVGKLAEDYHLQDIVSLDEPGFRPHVITEKFWRGWDAYQRPTLVSFNGRGFDIPLLELAAFRYGVAVPAWFAAGARSYEQRRNRYNQESHFDIHEFLTNFGSTRFTGGLNLAANLLGKPGKMGIQGHMVQDLWEAGKVKQISDYCRCDVLDTYFAFLRTRVMAGQITLNQEHALVARTKDWLVEQSRTIGAYAEYLENFGDWPDPWA